MLVSSEAFIKWFDHLAFPPRPFFNATLAGMSMVFTLVMMIAVCAKKNKTIMSAPFIVVSVSLTISLFSEVVSWLYLPGLYSLSLYKVVFAVDFISIYLGCLAMFWYLDTYVYLLAHPEIRERKKWSGRFKLFVLIYSLMLFILFASSMWTEWYYVFDQGTFAGYKPAYRQIMLLSSIWQIVNVVRIVKEWEHIGSANAMLFMAYLVIPMAAFVTDTYDGLGLGCIVTAVILFVIFVRIDIAQGERLLEQKTLVAQKEAEMAETKMELMMSQIQPHFLYNALSTISYLCTQNPGEAQRATNEFANFLRGNLQYIGSKSPIPFEIEMEHVRNYLSIEKRRFPDRLIIEQNIRSKDFMIPALTMQTLVENAVKYSVNAKYDPTTVRIETQERPNENLVIIRDDGPGFDVNARLDNERRHIGLEGAKSRLKEMMDGYLEINSIIGQGTTVTIHIPKESKR